jgi:murein DD-endopeptidase MepM/ murein hydrolase activator NlpD
MADKRGRPPSRSRAVLRRVVVVLGLVAASAAIAAPVVQGRALTLAGAEIMRVMHDLPGRAPVTTAQVRRLVWDGVDVDGDGRPDFANPTGRQERGEDAYGEGRFGASRDGGLRRHEGADFVAEPGQSVVAPISGYVTKIGYAYAGDQDLKFVEITNPALHYVARAFYVDPTVAEGDTVAIGHPIGHSHSLQRKYPEGMTDHVHLEIIGAHERRIDPARVITARWEDQAVAKG